MTEQVLAELARRYGVATEFDDWIGRRVAVPDDTLVAVLGALGVTAAVVLGLIIAPASFAPAQQAGLIGGKTGFVAIVLGCGALTLAGLGIGALVNVGRRGVAFALAALYVPLGLGLHQLGVARAPVSRFPTAMTAPSFPRPRTLVYGIDGADFRVIDPMIARGELPNLKALIDRGAHGELIAPEPLASPVVWTTIFTGQLPKTHGLTDWLVSDARSRLVPTLWEIFSANDARSVVVNVPGSWPPHAVPGAQVLAGFPLPGLAAPCLPSPTPSSTPWPANTSSPSRGLSWP